MPSTLRFLGQIVNRKSEIVTLRARGVALAVVAFAFTGCQTYTEKSADRDHAVRSGDIASAVARADKDAEKNKDNKDTILYRLEQGAILRSAALANLGASAAPPGSPPALTDGQTQTNAALHAATPDRISPRIGYLTRSLAAFDEAARRIDDYETAAKIRVGAETGALFTNQANLPYRGRAYDKVMLHTYQALNYLQLGDGDAARVELNRALQRQRDAVEANGKRIAEAQKLARDARSGGVRDDQGRQGQSYDVDRAKSDPRTSSGLASVESKFNAAILPYGDYVNPFTTFLDALVFTHQAADASDLERARKSWERVVNFATGNPYARADYIAVEPDLQPSAGTLGFHPAPDSAPPPPSSSAIVVAAVPASPHAAVPVAPAVLADTVVPPATPAPDSPQPPPGALTYVIFETGSAPYRDEVRIDIPLFLVTSGVSYVGAAFPRLETVEGYASQLRITTSDGGSHPTSLVASIDSVVAQDFKNEWPSILTKTLVSTATKATIDAVLQKQIEDETGATGALLFKLTTAITQAAINIADTRTWRSLPKEFQYARLPTPADRRLVLATGTQSIAVAVEPAAVTVVYVKSTGGHAPLLVSQFILKK